jgi:hypothetical protein
LIPTDGVETRANGGSKDSAKTTCYLEVPNVSLSVIFIAADDCKSTGGAQTISDPTKHLQYKRHGHDVDTTVQWVKGSQTNNVNNLKHKYMI